MPGDLLGYAVQNPGNRRIALARKPTWKKRYATLHGDLKMANSTNDEKLLAFRAMADAIRAGDDRLCGELIDAHSSLLTEEDNANTFLRMAARKNKVKIVELLVNRGVDINTPQSNGSPEGPVLNAVGESAMDVVRWMLDHGAKLNHVVDAQTRCFALNDAARAGNMEMVWLLVEHGADVNANWKGETPLTFAIMYGQDEVAKFLRSKGAIEPVK